MATTIQEYATEVDVQHLLHFTRESNLDSILAHGLVTRDVLVQEGVGIFNDDLRADGTQAVCVSIGFPNYKMWWSIRSDNPGVDWVLLVIEPKALWELPCAFCYANAALAEVASTPIEHRQTLQAFQAMYADDVPGKGRAQLGIEKSWPTNPQAEVLMLRGVPRGYIRGVVTKDAMQQARIKQRYPRLETWVSSDHFYGRKDYTFWQSGG